MQRSSEQWLRDESGPLPDTVPLGCALIPLVVVVSGLAFLWVARMHQRQLDSFKANMATTKGVVIDGWVSSTPVDLGPEPGMLSGSEDDYHIGYQFEVPAPAGPKRLQADASVSEEAYNSLKKGAELTVRYDRTNPSFSRIEGETGLLPFVLVTFGVMQVGVGVIGVPVVLMERKKKLALARGGERLAGRIVECAGRRDDDGHLQVDVKYQFVSPSGREISASRTAARPDLTEQTLPAAQTPVIVLYASDSNYQLM